MNSSTIRASSTCRLSSLWGKAMRRWEHREVRLDSWLIDAGSPLPFSDLPKEWLVCFKENLEPYCPKWCPVLFFHWESCVPFRLLSSLVFPIAEHLQLPWKKWVWKGQWWQRGYLSKNESKRREAEKVREAMRQGSRQNICGLYCLF